MHTKGVTPLSCSVLIWRRCYLRCRLEGGTTKPRQSALVLFHTNRWGGITVQKLPPCAPTLPRSPAHLPAISSSACKILISRSGSSAAGRTSAHIQPTSSITLSAPVTRSPTLLQSPFSLTNTNLSLSCVGSLQRSEPTPPRLSSSDTLSKLVRGPPPPPYLGTVGKWAWR